MATPGQPANRCNVGILVFDEVEVLDFAGPFEVFSRTRLVPGTESRRTEDSAPFCVFTVAAEPGPIAATGGLVVEPSYTFDTAPPIQLLVVPGGFGTRPLLESEPLLDWLRDKAASAAQVASVCTGSLLLARAGLLKDRCATCHWGAVDLLASIDPSITVERHARVVHDVVTSSAGVSAGIDMALAIVERMFGVEVANETAHYIDYPRDRVTSPA